MTEYNNNDGDYYPDPEDVFVLPIEDHIDLHTFSPKELPYVLEEYLLACREKNILEVRIIHGKGKGVLKKRVESYLNKCDFVVSYSAALPERGGWGAVIARLQPL